MREHRSGRRVEIAIPVRLHFADGTFGLGLAMNVGWGGMFIRTSQRLQRSGSLEVEVTVPTAVGEHTVVMPALVAHRETGGIGVVFRQLDERAMRVVAWLKRGDDDTPWPSRRQATGIPAHPTPT